MTFRGLHPNTAFARWGLVAVSIGIVIGATLPTAIDGVSRAIVQRPENLPWYTERVVGFLAYFALTGSVVYGLLLSTKLLDAIAHRPITFTLHQDLAAIGLGLAAIHGALLGLDHAIPFSVAAIAVPFAAPYAPVFVGSGQIAFYIALAVVGSFYLRRRIGQRAWRTLHYATFLGFAFATVHGIGAGTDGATRWAWWLYVGSIVTVAFLVTYRITLAVTGGQRASATVRATRAGYRAAGSPAVGPDSRAAVSAIGRETRPVREASPSS